MDNVTRIGVSIEPDLLDRFDQMIARKGYVTRSEAFRDLIRDALTQTFVQDETSQVCGTITLIYNHHKGDVKEKLTDIQHEHHELISSSIHVHLDLDRCLEVLVVSGTVAQVKHLADRLGSVRGVQNGIPVMMSSEVTEHEHTHEDGSDHHH